jgi:hypothetical protein
MRTDPAKGHTHQLSEVVKALAGKAMAQHVHQDVLDLLDAIEKDAAVTKALLLAATGGGSFHPPAPEPTGPVLYIAPSGDDTTGDGTQTYPWATLQKWIDSAPVAGATLDCRGGTFADMPFALSGHEHYALTGTSGAPITIRNHPGETPVFSGGSGPLLGLATCGFVVVDGLAMDGRVIGDSGYIFSGAYEQAGYPAHDITLRNLVVDFDVTGRPTTEHAIYPSQGTERLTLEDSIIRGPGSGNAGGYGFHAFSSAANGPRDLAVRRTIFDGWNQAGLLLWDAAITGAFDHLTFVRNVTDARLEHHGLIALTNSAFDTASGSSAISDPYDSADTTLGYNFFGQTFDASYLLTAGQTGRGAASDGTDAGALDW